ncbi:hypothetical protein [Sphingomicrobium sediminis]|uniref:Uncharacterized protein n=1 Tax=Sphingomicrobium sediminis TaxID=2950949 RepID=A0A9X2EJ74_9SPHN|nr:hypothetical protein [Sphingomicrobium sediminis]MCM8557776.1 hypothetical protein [Sphingomicrobium sediminis]
MKSSDEAIRATISGIAMGGVVYALVRGAKRLGKKAPAVILPNELEEPLVAAARLVG